MKKLIIVLFGSCLFFTDIHAQFTRYIVKFKNKGGIPFSLSTPTAFLSQRAIDRRTRYGIAIDSTDLPVTPSYITQIKNVSNVTVLNISKWQNSVSIQTSDPNAITTINGFSFVQSVAPIAARTQNNTTEKLTIADQPYFSTQRVTGITDFFNYTTLDAMDSIIINNQVLDTWDFYTNNTTVSDDHPHGMQCLSTISANIPGQFIGKAPKANFMLYRTEDVNSE